MPQAIIAPVLGAVATLGSGIASAVAAHSQGNALENRIKKAEGLKDSLQSNLSQGPHQNTGLGLADPTTGNLGLKSLTTGSTQSPFVQGFNTPPRPGSFSGSNLIGRSGL